MNKNIRYLCILTAVMAIFAGGVWAMDHAEKAPTDAKEPGCPLPIGQAVLEYVTVNNPYLKWNLWPGKEKLYPGQHPHGAFLTTYVSPLAFYAIQDHAGQIPDTAFIVKENYSPEKQLAAVTVMYKVKDYNPEAGDWFWLKYTPDGKIAAEGKIAGCIDCHTSTKDNDWLFTGPLK